jgi:hypothetical protein
MQKGAPTMNEMEKYLAALEAAVEVRDSQAIALLDPFATHLYKEIYAHTNAASGEERAVWEGRLQRVKDIISGMAKAGPDIW